MLTIARARAEQARTCYQILDSARAFQREQGFFQWPDDYPNLDVIQEDIRIGRGYILLWSGRPAGYLSIDMRGDPDYADALGVWHVPGPYAVIHRMGIGTQFRGRGLSAAAFALVDDLCRAEGIATVRVDTFETNLRMQHVLECSGYIPCGPVEFPWSRALAYDKDIR